MRLFIQLLISSGILLSLNSYALKSDFSKAINVVSNEQIAELSNNKVTFLGNVEVTQGSMIIKADKIEIKRGNDNKLEYISAYGSPVSFKQTLDNGKPINTKSSTLQYKPKENLIVLTGRASIWQGESKMSGERIEYNTLTQTMRANDKQSKGGRVSSTFIPSELKE